MSKTLTCYVCGNNFDVAHRKSSDAYMCHNCRNDKAKQLNRIFTKDTVFLVCKWYNEGMTIAKIADVLKRSPHNIRLALKQGGIVKK